MPSGSFSIQEYLNELQGFNDGVSKITRKFNVAYYRNDIEINYMDHLSPKKDDQNEQHTIFKGIKTEKG